MTCLIHCSDGKRIRGTISRCEISLTYWQFGYKYCTLIDMIAGKGEAGSLRCRPNQHAILQTEIGGRIKLLARYHNADNGLAALIPDFHICLLKRNLHTFILNLIIDNGSVVDVSAANGSRLRLDNKEILQGLGAVKSGCQVCQVVTELHRFVMDAIGPSAQHRHFWSRIGTQRIARIAEMFKGYRLFRLSGIQVLGDTSREQKLAAVCIIHQQLDGA